MKRADWREKAARQAIRAREKAELARLRLELEHAQERRRRLVREARARCKAHRLALRDKLRERRRLERERIKAEFAAARRTERGTCKAGCVTAKRVGSAAVSAAKSELEQARRSFRLNARQAKGTIVKVAHERVARIHESDDAARRDIPAELQGIWDRVKARFKTGGRRSRAEAFLEWAEENPGEIVAMQQVDADRDVARLLREHAKHTRKMKVRKTRAEIARELEAIPF